MKSIFKTILFSAFAVASLTACSDATETEIKNPADLTHNNKTEAYYEQLRAYKKTDHPVAFGWFGQWSGKGASLENSLAGLPDSVDMVSIWGNWNNPSEEQLKDLRFVQEKKGTKAMICFLVLNIGDQLTPEQPKEGPDSKLSWTEWRHKTWGWGSSLESKIEAAKKYATAICDIIDKYGYDGFDMDAEPHYTHYGVNHPYEMWETDPKIIKAFVETLAKRLGPASGTDKLLVVDGEPNAIDAKYAKYFNYFILQTYSDGFNVHGFDFLQNRFNTQYNHFQNELSAEEIAKKIIVCENYERFASTGGFFFNLPTKERVPSLKAFALWNPMLNGITYRKGGVGTFHMEYEYNVDGKFYPSLRQAIQIMNPSKRN